MYYYIQTSKFFHVVNSESLACEGGRLFLLRIYETFSVNYFCMPFLLLIFAMQINGFNEQNPLRVILRPQGKG